MNLATLTKTVLLLFICCQVTLAQEVSPSKKVSPSKEVPPSKYVTAQLGIFKDFNKRNFYRYEIDYSETTFERFNWGVGIKKNNKIHELNLGISFYEVKWIGFVHEEYIRDKTLLELEYYRSIFFIDRTKHTIHGGFIAGFSYNRDYYSTSNYFLNYLDVEEYCVCFSAGFKLSYAYSISDEWSILVSSKTNLLDLGYDYNLNYNLNSPHTGQEIISFRSDFIRDRILVDIGIVYTFQHQL